MREPFQTKQAGTTPVLFVCWYGRPLRVQLSECRGHSLGRATRGREAMAGSALAETDTIPRLPTDEKLEAALFRQQSGTKNLPVPP